MTDKETQKLKDNDHCKYPLFRTTERGHHVLTAASIEHIVETYATETQELELIHAVVLAHGHFFNSKIFLAVFVRHFKKTEDQGTQFRIISFIKKWIELAVKDFEPQSELRKELENFVKILKEKKPDLAKFIQSTLELQGQPHKEEEEIEIPPIISLKKKKKVSSVLLSYDSEEIARQLTLIDYDYLRGIDRQELLKTRWTTPEKAPTLFLASNRVNTLAYWFAFQLVQEPKLKTRIKILDHMIRISIFLMKIHNFNSLMALFLALNMRCSTRLTETWKGLKPKVVVFWKRVSSLMNPKENFASYRELIENISFPYIPCQEIVLKDLLYHNEGCPNFVVETAIVDMNKLYVMGKIIDIFRKCQETPFHLEEFPELSNVLRNIRSDITTNELDELCDRIDPDQSKILTSPSLLLTARGPAAQSDHKLNKKHGTRGLSLSEFTAESDASETSDVAHSEAGQAINTSREFEEQRPRASTMDNTETPRILVKNRRRDSGTDTTSSAHRPKSAKSPARTLFEKKAQSNKAALHATNTTSPIDPMDSYNPGDGFDFSGNTVPFSSRLAEDDATTSASLSESTGKTLGNHTGGDSPRGETESGKGPLRGSKRHMKKVSHDKRPSTDDIKGAQWWMVDRAEIEDDEDDDDDDDNDTDLIDTNSPTSITITPFTDPNIIPPDHSKVKRTKSKSKKKMDVIQSETGDPSGNITSRTSEDLPDTHSEDRQLQRSKSRKKGGLIRVVKKSKDAYEQDDTT